MQHTTLQVNAKSPSTQINTATGCLQVSTMYLASKSNKFCMYVLLSVSSLLMTSEQDAMCVCSYTFLKHYEG